MHPAPGGLSARTRPQRGVAQREDGLLLFRLFGEKSRKKQIENGLLSVK